MLGNLKQAIKNSAIYGLGTLSIKLLGLILIPIYTKHFSTNVYGILSMIEVTAQVLTSVLGLSLYQALFRFYWDKEHKEKQKSIFFTTLLFIAVIAFLSIIVLMFFTNKASQLLFDSPKYHYLIKIMILNVGFQMVIDIISTLLRLQEKAFLFSVSNILRLSINLIFTVVFIIVLNKGVESVFEAQLLGSAVFILFLLRYVIRNSTPVFEKDVLKAMLSYSVPLVISTIAALIINSTDRYFLRFYTDLSKVGIYSLGYKIANIILFINMSVQLAIGPMFFKFMNEPNNKRFYSKMMTYLAFSIMFFVLGLSMFSKEAVKVLAKNPEYWQAYILVPFLAISVFFTMLKDVSILGLSIVKQTKIISAILILVCILNVVLNYFLIPVFSILGSALACLLTQITYFILIYINAQRKFPIPFEIKKILLILFVGISLIGISFIFNDFHILVRLVVKTSLILMFPFILFAFGFYEEIEIVRMRQAFQKNKNPKNWIKGIRNQLNKLQG
jgi:O-antigen/teichoic acid export membrane protein